MVLMIVSYNHVKAVPPAAIVIWGPKMINAMGRGVRW